MLCRDLPSVIGNSTSFQESSLNLKDSYCYISLGTEHQAEHGIPQSTKTKQ
jgi:hypothetical protein